MTFTAQQIRLPDQGVRASALTGTALSSLREWRPVAGYESLYEVSNFGEVRSCRGGTARALAPVLNGGGYPTVKLYSDGRERRFMVHRLVCAAFRGPPPFEGAQVAHLDGERANPRLDNLAWVTRSENEAHKKGHGRKACGSRNGRAKLTEAQATELRRRYVAGEPAPRLGREFGISRSQAHRVATQGAWEHV